MENTLYDVMKQATWRDHWRPATFWLTVTVITSLIPPGFGIIAILFWGKNIVFSNFVIHGEFTMYCVGLLTTSLVMVGRELKEVGFPNRPSFIFLGALGLSGAALFHGLIVGASTAGSGKVNVPLTVVVSTIAYIYTIVLSFLVIFVNAYREQLNLKSLLQVPERKLENEFDKLGK